MLSFTPFNNNAVEKTVDVVWSTSEEKAYVDEIYAAFKELASEGVEVAYTYDEGCLLYRIYDEDYFFVYPITISDNSDIEAALIHLSEYVRREMIPFFLTDVPREELDFLGKLFPHINAGAHQSDEDVFSVFVLNECIMTAKEEHQARFGRIRLDEIGEGDKASYARLCRDEDVNYFWGYDYSEDKPDATDEYFLEVVERERFDGVALSLAARLSEGDGSLIGEVVLFDFDYRGSAMLAIRLLPEYQGQGLGTEAFKAGISLARSIGLSTLRARVNVFNTASMKMTSSLMQRVGEVVRNEAEFVLKL